MNCNSIINKRLLVIVFLFTISTQGVADGWSLFSQHAQMKDYVIVEAGDVSKVEPPFNTKWKTDLYQINGSCFMFSGYMGYWGYGNKSALLLVNMQKNIQLALIEVEIGTIKVKLYSILMMECPSRTNIMSYSDDPKEQLRLLKQRQENLKERQKKLNNKLKELQKQR